MITISSEANIELNKIYFGKHDQDLHLRIFVKAVGWGGPIFGVSLDKKHEGDVQQEIDGMTFVVDKDLMEYFRGFKIDFMSGWISKRFLIEPITGPISKC